MFSSLIDLIRRAYTLAAPYGRKKLVLVVSVALLQGIFQVVGITSVFPFLALASNPEMIRNSEAGAAIIGVLPEMTNQALLLWAGSFAILMLCLTNVINLASEFIRTYYAQNFGHWLRLRLLERYASQPYTYFLITDTSILKKKILGDVGRYVGNVLLPLLDCLARFLTVSALLLTLFLVNPLIAGGATLFFLLFYFIVFRILRVKRDEASEGLKEAGRGAFISMNQFLSGIKPIFARDLAYYFFDRFRKFSRAQCTYQTLIPVYTNGPRYILEPFAFGGVVAIVMGYVATGKEFSSLIPQLGIIALAGYRLLPAFQLFYAQLTALMTNRHALDEVYDELYISEGEITSNPLTFDLPPALPFQTEVTLKNVVFVYPRTHEKVLKGVDLKFQKGQKVAFVGPTGSGKSTLVDLLLGLLSPSEGEILIDETPLNSGNLASWRQNIGYVPQDIFLMGDTISRNIAYGIPDQNIEPERLRKAAEMAQILDFIEEELPDRFETWTGERGTRLSGGQRQRIGLARALYYNPSVLILDEATSALDNETEAHLMNAIHQLPQNLTIVMIAHRLSTVRNCDLIFYLEKGKILGQGTFETLQEGIPQFKNLVEQSNIYK